MSGSGDDGQRAHAMGSGSGDSGGGQYPHIEGLLRALHQPNINVSRPRGGMILPLSLVPAATAGLSVLGNIEEQIEEVATLPEDLIIHRPALPVLFDIESVSETSSNPPSPDPSSANLDGMLDATGEKKVTPSSKQEENLERFNKSVISVMDTLRHSRGGDHATGSLTPSASTGKPFAFYHRMHRHSSAHSLNIPNIVVTGSGDQQQNPSHHHNHLKRFSFGLRRHSHAVVGDGLVLVCPGYTYSCLSNRNGLVSFRLTRVIKDILFAPISKM